MPRYLAFESNIFYNILSILYKYNTKNMSDIQDKMASIIYDIFKNNNLLETIKQHYKNSDLIISLDVDINDNSLMNVNLFKKLKKSEFIKRELPKYKKVTENDTDSNCCICLEEYKHNTYKRTLNCNHHFHKKCIDKWFRNCDDDDISCPMCRSKYELKLDKISSFTLNDSANSQTHN
jgi:hypothetical protein